MCIRDSASAVAGDIMDAARNKLNQTTGVHCTCIEHKPIKPMGRTETKYFVRLTAQDKPGVLASIAYRCV